MLEFIFNSTPKKLSKYLYEVIPSIDFSIFRNLLKSGDIKVNNKKVKTDVLLAVDDVVRVYYVEPRFIPTVEYEDENIIVIDKPIKLASEGNSSLESKVNEYFSSEFILAHRLDTNTSGLVIFAKSKQIFDALVLAFRNREIKKYYLARVFGEISEPITYNDYLLKNSETSTVKIYPKPISGALAITTKVIPITVKDGTTICEVELITGRTHQIRAHLAYHGHFIIGDGKYGYGEINKRYGLSYQALVSYKLEFLIKSGSLSYLNGKIINKNVDKFFE